jgi:hydroxymethylpyrimidine/phosphomethylpyrimidine kinase
LSRPGFSGYTASVKKVLTIAGFDPSGGAGIQADLKVFRTFGEYGLSVAAALTAQNSRGVSAVMAVDAPFVRKQLVAVLSDFIPDAVKIGMLYSGENVNAVATVIREYALRNIVFDPVMRSSSGKRLAEAYSRDVILKKLLPLCTVVTPNMDEASFLTGVTVRSLKDMEEAALRLKGYGCDVVIITGGHLEKTAMDVFYDGEFHYLRSRKISGEFHGTGCAFSSAVAAALATEKTPLQAAKTAKLFMNRALKRSFGTGASMRLLHI